MTTVHTPTGPPKVRAAKSWDKLRRKPSWSQPSSPEEKDAVAAGKRSPDENRAGRSSNTHDEGAFAGAMAKLKVSPPKGTDGATRGESSSPPDPAPASDPQEKPAETQQPTSSNERRSAHETRVSSSSSAEPSSTDSAPGADARGEDGLDRGAAFEWLLQRQIEVEMTLREKKVASREDLEHVAETFRDLNELFLELHAAAAELTAANKRPCSVAALFQELLHKIAGVNAGLGMEGQRGEGNVPMHQAKVLDRRHRTGEECGDVNMVLGPERVRGMVLRVRDLRQALRIKVEDANDVRMAEEAVKAGHAFWTKLREHAKRHGADAFAALTKLRDA